MKKLLTLTLCILIALLAVSCTNKEENQKKLDELFDENPQNQVSDNTENGNEENLPDAVPDAEKEEGKQDESKEDQEEIKYVIQEAEQQLIINRYTEAESFYYDMQNQNFELDNMDVITHEADGYEMTYHRVLLTDINSLSELKSTYLSYFTSAFVEAADFSAYREENGKLYCAELTGSISDAEYSCSVETVDEKNAVVVRKQGTSIQRIPAVKSGDTWFFGAVAIR